MRFGSRLLAPSPARRVADSGPGAHHPFGPRRRDRVASELRAFRPGSPAYDGNGQEDRSGGTGWHPNSGNPIGNGWGNFRVLLGAGNGVILAVEPNGDLRWYSISGTARRTGRATPGGIRTRGT
jgi:hypothetical protein